MKRLLTGLFAFAAAGTLAFAGAGSDKGAQGASAPVKITVEVFDRGTDGGKTNPTNNKWTQWIHDKLLKDENINVTFVAVPRWTESEALVNLFAAGTPPDVCYTYSGDNIQLWADQGGVHDLAPYINTALKDLDAFLGPDKAIPGKRLIERNVEVSTGKIHSLPSKRLIIAQRVTYIRSDWLSALGLGLPTTKQEFWDALTAFKDKNPGKITGAVSPFIMSGDRPDYYIGNLIESFYDPKMDKKERWINTAADREFALPGYKEGLRYVNRMYNAGLIDKDWVLIRDGEAMKPLIQSGVAGSFSWDWDNPYREPNGIISVMQQNVPGSDFTPIDPFESSDGLTHKTCYDNVGLSFFVPKASKNPEAALRYINWLSRYENYHFIQTGPEGITHTIVDGVLQLDPNAKADPTWIQNSNQNIDYTLMMNGFFLETEEASIKSQSLAYAPWKPDVILKSYNMALVNAAPNLVVKTTSPLTAAAPLAQTLQDKGKVLLANAINCPEGQFDATFDAALADWLASGGKTIIDERRAKFPK